MALKILFSTFSRACFDQVREKYYRFIWLFREDIYMAPALISTDSSRTSVSQCGFGWKATPHS
jgi:hypothetical protein